MPGLPHWDNSTAAAQYYEPVFLNQFEVVITPPPSLVNNEFVGILVEHVTKISGLPEMLTKAGVKQRYKFAERNYSDGAPDKTSVDLTIEFEVNLNDQNNMYVYNLLRAWGDLIYDPLNGRQGLKKDYIGEIAVVVFNKAGDIFREYKFKPVFLADALNPIDLEYTKKEVYKITAKFISDTYRESRIGQITI
jgi:hypothetical protein